MFAVLAIRKCRNAKSKFFFCKLTPTSFRFQITPPQTTEALYATRAFLAFLSVTCPLRRRALIEIRWKE